MTKKVIRECLQGFYAELDGDRVADVVSELNALIAVHGDTLLFGQQRDYYGNYSKYIMKERLETDEEYTLRIESELEFIQYQKEKELKLLAELKAKYEHQEHN